MPNMSLKEERQCPSQDAGGRATTTFEEVALGYTEEQAVDEASRCLHCKNKPCVGGCPVAIDIPDFIAKIAEEDFEGAYRDHHPASPPCPPSAAGSAPRRPSARSKCVRGIKGEPVAIGRLERFVADWHNAHATEDPGKAPRPTATRWRWWAPAPPA